MANRHPRGLLKPETIAYLLKHAERLTEQGVFKDHPSARTVFLHWCCHPDASLPPAARESFWTCPVSGQPDKHYDPPVIAKATGISERQVRRAIDWLEDEGLVHVDHGSGKRKDYGPVTIVSTSQGSEWDRQQEQQRIRRRSGHGVPSHPLSPATGHHVPTEDTMSPFNGSPAVEDIPKRKRTVAATRKNALNSPDLPSSGSLESAGEAHSAPVMDIPPDDVPRECPGPVTRPSTDLRGAHRSGEAGPYPIDDPIDVRHAPRRSKHPARNCGPGAEAEVDRVMALLSDLPGWDTATARSPGRVRGREAQPYVRPGLSAPWTTTP